MGNSVRDQFLKAIYDQIWANLKAGGVAQGSNFWNLYTVGIGDDDPYQITLADTSTVAIIDAHVSKQSPAKIRTVPDIHSSPTLPQ